MKDQFKKLVAGLLLFSLTLGMFSVSAGAAVTADTDITTAAVSGQTSEAVVSSDSFVKSRSEAISQLDISSAKWKKVNGQWRLRSSSGKYKKGFVKYKGSYYFFDSNGNLKVGFFTTGGKKYFASRTTGAKGKGKILTGWRKIDGYYYYLNPASKPHKGAVMTGWQKIGGKWYYLNGKGIMQTGWRKLSGKWYYLSASGAMQTGWLKHGGNWYYLSSSGAMLTGTHKIGNATYQFDTNGKLVRKVTAAAQPAPASSRYAHVLDVSQWQGKIDFNKVKASGVSAVIIRCGYGKYKAGGSMNTDSYFYQNIKNAKAAGLAVGVYYFSYAYTRQQAINEANHCLRIIKGYGLNLPVYFDWEYDSMTKAKKFMGSKAFKKVNWRSNITDMTAAFCDTITKGGYRAGYYFNLQYLNNYYTPSKLTRYSTWYAIWGNNKPGANPWLHANKMSTPTKYDVWQFTSRGKIPGINGYVDCDLLLKPSIKK